MGWFIIGLPTLDEFPSKTSIRLWVFPLPRLMTLEGTKHCKYPLETLSFKHNAMRCRRTPSPARNFTMVIEHSLEINSWEYRYQMETYYNYVK